MNYKNEKDKRIRRVGVSFTKSIFIKLKELADEQKLSLSSMVVKIVVEYLENLENKQ